jgi:hypothetical protein
MATTDIEQDGRRTAWRNPVLQFEGSCRAPAEVVYDLLADLHATWTGPASASARPPGCSPWRPHQDRPASGSSSSAPGQTARPPDGRTGRWSPRPRALTCSSSTDGHRQGKPGRRPWLCTAVHRYVIAPEAGGCRVTYTEDLTRLHGAPWMLRTPGVTGSCSGSAPSTCGAASMASSPWPRNGLERRPRRTRARSRNRSAAGGLRALPFRRPRLEGLASRQACRPALRRGGSASRWAPHEAQ